MIAELTEGNGVVKHQHIVKLNFVIRQGLSRGILRRKRRQELELQLIL
jgi:hypothetical protein